MNYNKLVPEDSFIGQYLEYMSYVETANSYDFWCAVWAIGTGVGYDVYVDRPNSAVHLNWYIILCAESGTTRKSTAIDSISDIVTVCEPILTNKTSAKNLESVLHESYTEKGSASATFAVRELVTILGRERYVNSMPELLTDLYDCARYRKSRELEQEKVYVNFISASTPSWLVTAINPSVIEGGFTSRVIFVHDDSRKKSIAWPQQRPEGTFDFLQQTYIGTILDAKDNGPIGISKGGLRKFTHWYNHRATHTDPYMASFEAREDDHVLRLAGCLAINDGTHEIQSSHITNAIRVLGEAKERAVNLFGGGVSYAAKITNGIAATRKVLIAVGQDGISHTKLYARVRRHVDTKELRLLMDIMHECGMVQMFKLRGGTVYRATQHIEQLGVTSEVLSKLNLD
jgi:hypothetical protein